MTVAFVCVMVAFLLIYGVRILVIVGQSRMPGGLDNRHPRDQQAALPGWARRAQAAHLNSFEAFAPFAAAVIISHLAGANRTLVDVLAVVFVGARVFYPLCYLLDVDKLRTAIWSVGFLAVCGIFIAPLVT